MGSKSLWENSPGSGMRHPPVQELSSAPFLLCQQPPWQPVRRTGCPLPVPLFLLSSLKPNVVKPGSSLLERELRSTGCVSSSATADMANHEQQPQPWPCHTPFLAQHATADMAGCEQRPQLCHIPFYTACNSRHGRP